MRKYTSYVKGTKRKIIVEEDLTIEAAIRFLSTNRNGVIFSDDIEYTKEELKNVKNIRPDLELGSNRDTSGGGTVLKDSDRELFNFIRDYTK